MGRISGSQKTRTKNLVVGGVQCISMLWLPQPHLCLLQYPRAKPTLTQTACYFWGEATTNHSVKRRKTSTSFFQGKWLKVTWFFSWKRFFLSHYSNEVWIRIIAAAKVHQQQREQHTHKNTELQTLKISFSGGAGLFLCLHCCLKTQRVNSVCWLIGLRGLGLFGGTSSPKFIAW